VRYARLMSLTNIEYVKEKNNPIKQRVTYYNLYGSVERCCIFARAFFKI
jgi:hypothetical protein